MKNLFRMFWKWILGIIKTINLELMSEDLSDLKNKFFYKWQNCSCGKNMSKCKMIRYEY
jgi:hypothetical protein